jgi:alkylated DNA repair dioxygenase AlkB
MSAATTTLQPRRRWRTILFALLVFIAGMATGGAVTIVSVVHHVREAIHHPERAPERVAKMLKHRLALNETQTAQVQEIARQRQAELESIRREAQPRVMSQLDLFRDQVSHVLDDKQKVRWQAEYRQILENWLPPMPPLPPADLKPADATSATTQPSVSVN